MGWRLVELGPGEKGIIRGIWGFSTNGGPEKQGKGGCYGRCGRNFKRLCEVLGLYPGQEVLVVENRGKGPLLVEVGGRIFALGRGQAEKIWVEPILEKGGPK
ncbi:MAG: hypothetical protein DSZ24_05145 [Thermodesulfatator sp.]|nr:MAG: hypothetical protein DSZ24_05145 [Thermodesulfatator sp.]